MNTKTTLRTAQILVGYNGFGSSSGTEFAAGTPMADVIAAAQQGHDWSTEMSSDNLRRDIFVNYRLFSVATGRELRKVNIVRHDVTPRCAINTLSPRQREVFNLRHLSDEVIAARIGCSAKSVEQYRNQAIDRASRTGFIAL